MYHLQVMPRPQPSSKQILWLKKLRCFALRVKCKTMNEVRAVVRVSQFHSEKRYGAWDVEAGHPFMRILGSHFVDPGAVWGANFQFRTTLIQRVTEAADVWQVAELSRRF